MSDFGFIDKQPGAVFILSGVASQPGPDRLLRPLTSTELAAMLEAGFAGFFDHFARQITEGQNRLLQGLDIDQAEALPELFQPVVSFPGVGRGYLQIPAQELTDGGELVGDGPRTLAVFFVAGQQLNFHAFEIELRSGSLIVKILGGLFGTGALTASVLFLAQPDYGYLRQDMQWNQRIEQILDGQACTVELGAKVDVQQLRRLAIDDLRLSGRDLTDAERRSRICYTQLLLRAAGAYPGRIDGIEGPRTEQAKREFAKKFGLTPRDLDSHVFYDALLDSIQRKI